jgi:hypothetical protein
MEDLKRGSHACLLYNTEDQHKAFISAFLHNGLGNNQKCLYIADAHTPETILGYLKDLRQNWDNSQFVVLTADETFLSDGAPDPSEMVALLTSETTCAFSEGYSGLCATAEMTWALREPTYVTKLIEFEVELNMFLPDSDKRLILCQYNMQMFEPKFMLNVFVRHPDVVIGTELCNNPYYLSPSEFSRNDLPSILLRRRLNEVIERKKMTEELVRYREHFNSLPKY